MDTEVWTQSIDEDRASALLGLTRDELRRLSESSGLGREEPGEKSAHRVFTYQELYQLCRLAVGSAV